MNLVDHFRICLSFYYNGCLGLSWNVTGIYCLYNEKFSQLEELETDRATPEIIMSIKTKDKIIVVADSITSKIKLKHLGTINRTSGPSTTVISARLPIYNKKIESTNIEFVTIEHGDKKYK